MATRPFSALVRRAIVLSLARIAARRETPSAYTDDDILRTTGPRLLTDAALQTVACEVADEPFGWLNVTAKPTAVRYGGIAFLPRHSFDADPAATYRGDVQKVEHLYAGALSSHSLSDSAGSWKTSAY